MMSILRPFLSFLYLPSWVFPSSSQVDSLWSQTLCRCPRKARPALALQLLTDSRPHTNYPPGCTLGKAVPAARLCPCSCAPEMLVHDIITQLVFLLNQLLAEPSLLSDFSPHALSHFTYSLALNCEFSFCIYCCLSALLVKSVNRETLSSVC